MSVIIDSQLRTYSDQVSGLTKFNPFLQEVPKASSTPIGMEKRRVTTSSSQTLGNQLSFLLGSNDFIGDMYSIVKLTYGTGVAAKALAMSAIKRVELIGSTGDIVDYDYNAIMSHLLQKKGAGFTETALRNAGPSGSQTEHLGCAIIPMPWSSIVTDKKRSPPLPGFLVNGSLEVRLTLRSTSDLTIGGVAPTGVECSLIYHSLQTIASLKQDMLALPSIVNWYKNFSTISNLAVTNSPTTIDISQFQGTLRSISLRVQQDSVTAEGDYWTLDSLTDLQINAGNQRIWETYVGAQYEINTDTLLLGSGDDGSQSVDTANVGNGVATVSFVGDSEELDFSGGLNMRAVRSADVVAVSNNASSTMDILGESSALISIKNHSIQRFFN